MKPLYLLILPFLWLATTAGAKSPNILLILTDDQGWSQMSGTMDPDLPEAQSDYLETPAMERLMKEGMRFTSGYSPAPLCTPTRRSILCGTSAARSGSEFRSDWVPADHMTIPKALKMANPDYRCAHFGKWGEQMISTPEECGYDQSDGETGNATGGMPNTLGVKGGHQDGPPHFVDNGDPKRTIGVTSRAAAFMKEQAEAGNPFYVQVSYYAVHLSVVAMEETIQKYKDKGEPDRGYTEAWAAMLDEMDQGVGRLLATIDQLDLADETYVFFTADNGGRGTVPGGDESRTATNFPLTGAKHSIFEGGLRVPFLARGPGITAGTVCRTPVVGYDFLPTFYVLGGGEQRLPDEVDGTSFADLLADAGAAFDRKHGPLFFHRPGRGHSAIRQDDYKLILNWNRAGKVHSRELYRIGENPREDGIDISMPEKGEALMKLMQDYLEKVDAETAEEMMGGKKKKKK